ncbi:MAG: efflux RND transporter permease subunit [Rickettsia sp.]|nr:efflux RND transporter permease subunit [Rickettsia sp.]
MNISQICIKRPVFSTVINLVIVILGMICFFKIQIRDLPDINPPVITVVSRYPGADGSYMEQQITQRIEDALKTINNLDTIKSISASGVSNVIITFLLSADMENSLNDVRAKISEIVYLFPKDMDEPIVSKMDINSFPSIWMTLKSSKHSLSDLTDIADQQISTAFDKLSSVGETQIMGSYYKTMNIEPIPSKMFQYNLSPLDLEAAVRSQNKDFPLGILKSNVKNYSLRLNNTLFDIASFENILVKKYNDGTIIKLSDVANVSYDALEENVILRYNGEKSMALGLVMQSDSNILALSKDIQKSLNKIRSSLPDGVQIDIAYDRSVPVKDSLKEIMKTIIEATLLVSAVIYLFLGSIRITIIPLLAIPISLITTVALMYVLGFSLNIFTLLSMIIAIGLVVDDAIVVLENAFRHYFDLKKNKFTAALDSSKEITFAVISMTLTLCSVFLPVGFIGGMVGKLLIEFAWTLAFTVLVSGFVALTLTPMLSSKLMFKSENQNNFVTKKFNMYFFMLEEKYLSFLKKILDNKKWVFLSAFLSILLLFIVMSNLEKAFMPEEDQGMIQVFYTGPEGMTLSEMDEIVLDSYKEVREDSKLNNYIKKFLKISGYEGSNTALGFIELTDWKKRDKSQDQIKNHLNKKFSKIAKANIFSSNPSSMVSAGSSQQISFYLQSNNSYEYLERVSQAIILKMEESDFFYNVNRDFEYTRPTVDFIVNKDKMYKFDVSLADLAQTIRYSIEQNEIGDFIMNSEIYDVILRYDINRRSSFSDLESILVKNKYGQMLPITNFVDMIEHGTSARYTHFNNLRSVHISSDLNSKYSIGKAAEKINKITNDILSSNNKTNVDIEGDKADFSSLEHENTKITYGGDIKNMQNSSSDILFTFFLAIIFIYLILAAQFESFVDPFIILCSVPFSVTGGVLALYIFKDSLNMYSNIGLIALIGLVTKNAIMLIEFSNQLQSSGQSLRNSIINSAKLRLRPILMTSIATIVGSIPLTLASGSGSASRNSIGFVIVGGMLIGTIFTLIIIPILSEMFKRETSSSKIEK